MSRDEVLAFGVPEDKVKEFQEVYNRDLRKAADRLTRKRDDDGGETRAAIYAMLKLIKQPDTLARILQNINKAYYTEPYKAEPKA